ncbi:MAG: hypothetical protein ACI8PT_001838 [Gammaproteobacteria bacterium]|jgi:hypothetical protein
MKKVDTTGPQAHPAAMEASVGVLVLSTQFPRIVGDGGNAKTWPFPVLFEVVEQATSERVVHQAAVGLVDDFVLAGQALVARGVSGITTSCGFLAIHQNALSSALGVPVASSSLFQASWIEALLPPGRVVGVLTIAPLSLTPTHLQCARVPMNSPVGGVDPNGHFADTILRDRPDIDVERARAEVVAGARALLAKAPSMGALVLECTNMSPYAADVSDALGLPVFDFVSFLSWFHAGLCPRRYFQHGAD